VPEEGSFSFSIQFFKKKCGPKYGMETFLRQIRILDHNYIAKLQDKGRRKKDRATAETISFL
jgi:hypothetical protein